VSSTKDVPVNDKNRFLQADGKFAVVIVGSKERSISQ
jgi:hypothetical protein